MQNNPPGHNPVPPPIPTDATGSMWQSVRQMLGIGHAAGKWSVAVQEDGRCGAVHYREAAGSLRFYWEFGGGDTIANINVGDEASWAKNHPWALGRRAEILQRVAAEVVRQRAQGCRSEIDDQNGWINILQA